MYRPARRPSRRIGSFAAADIFGRYCAACDDQISRGEPRVRPRRWCVVANLAFAVFVGVKLVFTLGPQRANTRFAPTRGHDELGPYRVEHVSAPGQISRPGGPRPWLKALSPAVRDCLL